MTNTGDNIYESPNMATRHRSRSELRQEVARDTLIIGQQLHMVKEGLNPHERFQNIVMICFMVLLAAFCGTLAVFGLQSRASLAQMNDVLNMMNTQVTLLNSQMNAMRVMLDKAQEVSRKMDAVYEMQANLHSVKLNMDVSEATLNSTMGIAILSDLHLRNIVENTYQQCLDVHPLKTNDYCRRQYMFDGPLEPEYSYTS
eukprot:Colp12_sorted_trinity150504_noHs@1125